MWSKAAMFDHENEARSSDYSIDHHESMRRPQFQLILHCTRNSPPISSRVTNNWVMKCI